MNQFFYIEYREKQVPQTGDVETEPLGHQESMCVAIQS